MSLRVFYLGVVGGVLFYCTAAYADPKLNASLSANRLNQNETVLLTLQVDWPKSEGSYGFGIPAPDLENLSLSRRGEAQEFFSRDGQDWVRKTFDLELKPLGPGKASVREFTVTYVEPATQRQGSFQVSTMQLTVEKMPADSLKPVLLAVCGSLFAAAFAGILTWLLRKNKKTVLSEPPLSEQEKKTNKIKAMMDSGAPSKEIFHRIAAEFRQFLSEYYKYARPQATQDELLQILKAQDVPFEEYQKVKNLLEKIQEAQYLPEQSAAGDYKSLQREILSFIESKKTLEMLTDGT